MQSKNVQFVIAVSLQVVLILGMILFKFSVLAGGTDVILQIQPVDPTDPLRGDYFTFRYEISSLPAYMFDYSSVRTGDRVYVPLQKNSGIDSAYGGVSKSKPASGNFLKATVTRGNENAASGLQGFGSTSGQIQLSYGLEQFYIPEGTGRALGFRNKTFARVAVDGDGNAVLKQLYINGKAFNPNGLEKAEPLPDEVLQGLNQQQQQQQSPQLLPRLLSPASTTPSSAGLADLTVVSVSPSTTAFTAVVCNQGTARSPQFGVRTTANDRSNILTHNALPPSDCTPVQSWGYSWYGINSTWSGVVSVTIDPLGEIPESNEDNNTFMVPLNVSPKTAPSQQGCVKAGLPTNGGSCCSGLVEQGGICNSTAQ